MLQEPSPLPEKVFVIYGRDESAHRELSLFIKSLGLEELTFDATAHSLGTNPFIAEIVFEGVRRADAVIVLFTPDELAALYSERGEYSARDSQGSRWQARPNVIFEAGLAYGIDREKTILVTLGADVSLFSDVSGIHFIRLDSVEGKQKLRDRLSPIVKVNPQLPDWNSAVISGDFASCIRKRWQYYDELDSLETALGRTFVGQTGISLLWMLQSVAQESLQNEKPISAKAFMQSIQTLFGNSIAGNAYWELILSGFMQFLDVDDWWIGEESWQNSIPCARVAKRGEMLLVKLAEVGDETLRLENPILARHKEVDYLIQLHQYAEASSLNSKVLRDFPGSPRAHFNQARIDAQLSCAPLAETDRLLGAARVSLAEAVEQGIVKLLVLTGNPEECRKPLDIVRNDNCLAPLFARWPEISKRLTDPKYIRERQGAAGGCVGSHMAIELPGGGMKAASDLKIGDRIIAWDTERSAKAEARIVAVQHHISQDAYMFNETYCFTSVHPVLTPLGWVRAGSMEIGMDLCMGTGAADRVTSIRKLNQLCEVIDITVDPYSTFIAGGLIVHNKR